MTFSAEPSARGANRRRRARGRRSSQRSSRPCTRTASAGRLAAGRGHGAAARHGASGSVSRSCIHGCAAVSRSVRSIRAEQLAAAGDAVHWSRREIAEVRELSGARRLDPVGDGRPWQDALALRLPLRCSTSIRTSLVVELAQLADARLVAQAAPRCASRRGGESLTVRWNPSR